MQVVLAKIERHRLTRMEPYLVAHARFQGRAVADLKSHDCLMSGRLDDLGNAGVRPGADDHVLGPDTNCYRRSLALDWRKRQFLAAKSDLGASLTARQIRIEQRHRGSAD